MEPDRMLNEQLQHVLDEGDLEAVDRFLMIRADLRDIRQAFTACARELRHRGIPEELLIGALFEDSHRRGEISGWAHLDSIFVAEARV
jgi:hypothetical protein